MRKYAYLERKGLVNGSGQRIDLLDYSYFNGKLVEIEESSNKSIGFKTLATNEWRSTSTTTTAT